MAPLKLFSLPIIRCDVDDCSLVLLQTWWTPDWLLLKTSMRCTFWQSLHRMLLAESLGFGSSNGPLQSLDRHIAHPDIVCCELFKGILGTLLLPRLRIAISMKQ